MYPIALRSVFASFNYVTPPGAYFFLPKCPERDASFDCGGARCPEREASSNSAPWELFLRRVLAPTPSLYVVFWHFLIMSPRQACTFSILRLWRGEVSRTRGILQLYPLGAHFATCFGMYPLALRSVFASFNYITPPGAHFLLQSAHFCRQARCVCLLGLP